MATSETPRMDEMVSAVETAVLVEAMKKATVIISLHDLNQVTAAAARAIERVQELEAQMAEACERLERILADQVDVVDRVDVGPCGPAGVKEFMALHGLEIEPTAFDGVSAVDRVDPVDRVEPGEGDGAAPEPTAQALEERAWLGDKGLDAATALLFVRWMSGMPRGTSVSDAAARWDLTDDQALAMMRRYGPVIGKLRELRGHGFDAKLAEFKDRLGVAA